MADTTFSKTSNPLKLSKKLSISPPAPYIYFHLFFSHRTGSQTKFSPPPYWIGLINGANSPTAIPALQTHVEGAASIIKQELFSLFSLVIFPVSKHELLGGGPLFPIQIQTQKTTLGADDFPSNQHPFIFRLQLKRPPQRYAKSAHFPTAHHHLARS